MKSVFKLDRKSNRFRVCPNCGLEHMVKHLGRDFCTDKCADDHYNQERRLKKQATTMLLERKQDNPAPIFDLGGPVESLPEVNPAWGESMKINLSILENLPLDEKHGSLMSIDSLLLSGFNFSQFTMQGKNNNIPEGIQSSFLIFGDYRIYRTDYSKVLIKKI